MNILTYICIMKLSKQSFTSKVQVIIYKDIQNLHYGRKDIG